MLTHMHIHNWMHVENGENWMSSVFLLAVLCVCVCACVCVLVAHSQRVLLQRAVLYQYQFSGFILYYSYRWRRKWQPTPVVLPGKPHGWRSLVSYSPWSHRVGHDWATSLKASFKFNLLKGPVFKYSDTEDSGFSLWILREHNKSTTYVWEIFIKTE